MSGGRDWTTTEARKLQDMRRRHVKVRDIARELGRTEDAIYSFLKYVPAGRNKCAGTKPIDPGAGRWATHEIETLRSMAEDGAGAEDIADALLRSAHAVRTKASHEGISLVRRGMVAPLRLERETNRFKRDAAAGSAALREALFRLVA